MRKYGILNSNLMIPDFPLRKTHFKRQFQNLEITHESSEIAGDKKGQFLSLHASYLPIQVLKTSLQVTVFPRIVSAETILF